MWFPRIAPVYALAVALSLAPLARAAGLADELRSMVGKTAVQLDRDHGSTLMELTAESRRAGEQWAVKLQGEDGLAYPVSSPLLRGHAAKSKEPALRIYHELTPTHVWTYPNAAGEVRYVIAQEQHQLVNPGFSVGALVLLGPAGERLGSWTFVTGYRRNLTSVDFTFDRELGAPVLTFHTVAAGNSRGLVHQLFAMEQDQLYLIRLEDADGRLIRNNLASGASAVFGKDVPGKDYEGWSELLASPSATKRLAALTYLAAKHRRLELLHQADDGESAEMAKLAHALREAPATRRLCEEHREAKHPWLRQAAIAALVPQEKIFQEEMLQQLTSSDPDGRAIAAHTLGSDGDSSAVPALIKALSDESVSTTMRSSLPAENTTRWWANHSLVSLTRQDFGFRWDAPLAERQVAIAKWQQWHASANKAPSPVNSPR